MGNDTQHHGARSTGILAGDVAEYLAFYSRALTKRNCQAGFFDAFTEDAWTAAGNAPAVPDVALRILGAPDPLAYYAFSDLNPRNTQSVSDAVETLRATRFDNNLSTPAVKIATQDGNRAIGEACAWVHRLRIRHAVIFLDAFGMQVEWKSLQAMVKAGRLDMWLRIPTWPAIDHMPDSDDAFWESWRSRLDRLFGDPGWSEHLCAQLRARPARSFPAGRAMDHVERSVIDRLKSIFPPHAVRPAGVWLARPDQPSSLLVFACASANTRAQALALKAADYLVSRMLRP